MRCVVLGMRNAVRCEIWCYGDMVIWSALQARAFALVNIFNCGMDLRSFVRCRSSYAKNAPNCARCCWRARVPVQWHLADLRFRSEIMESCVLKICMYCTIDYPGIRTNNPAY